MADTTKRKAKKKREREQKIKSFVKDFTSEDAFYRFMKKLKLSEKDALEVLATYGVVVKKEQKKFAKQKRAAIKQTQKLRREAKKEKKLREARRAEGEEYIEEVLTRFIETNEILTVEDYLIIKDELF